MGRLRPLVRRVLLPPSSMLGLDEPTRMPFWLRPASTFGRFVVTDFDNGRSLAFSHSSSARPPPDWCSQIVAVVPGASLRANEDETKSSRDFRLEGAEG